MRVKQEDFGRAAADLVHWPQKDFDALVKLREEKQQRKDAARLPRVRKAKKAETPTQA